MSTRLMVDENSNLRDFRSTAGQPQHKMVRLLAHIISYVFHPLFVPVYIILFLINCQPYLFSSFSRFERVIATLQFFMMYSFFPLVTVLLAKGLGFLDSVFLKTQKERIIPYIACMIFYFWIAYVLRHQPQFAAEIVQLAMAIFIASIFGLMLNIYMKVSMHAISVGVAVAFMFLIASVQPANAPIYTSVAILIAGAVCTARFIVSDHTRNEVYLGFFAGIVSQILAIWSDKILP